MLSIEWWLLRLIHLILLSRLVLPLRWLLVFLWRLSHNLIFYRLLVIVLWKWVRLLVPLVHGRSGDAHLIYLVYWLSLRLVYVVILLLYEPVVQLLILRMLGMHWHRVSLVQAQRGPSAVLKDVAWVRAHLRRFISQIQDLGWKELLLRLITVALPTRLTNSSLFVLKFSISLVLLRLLWLILQKEFASTGLVVNVAIDVVLVASLFKSEFVHNIFLWLTCLWLVWLLKPLPMWPF